MTSIHVRRLAATVAHTRDRIVNHLRGLGLDDNASGLVRDVSLPWYQVRADTDGRAVNQEAPASIFIYDEIGGSLGVDASSLVQEIEAITAPEIRVRINSPGGSVFDAVAIYNALNHHSARIVTYVDALAASAASVIAMAGDEIVMMPGSQMMIHDASATEQGNAEDHRKLGTFLDRQSDNIAGIYALRAGGTDDDWRMLMLEETWAFAGEAVTLGLADRVEQPPARVAPDPDRELMARTFDLGRFRYAGRPAAPDPGTGTRERRRRTARAAVTAEPRPEFARGGLIPAPTGPTGPPARVQAALARRNALSGLTGMTGQGQTRQAATMALGTAERRLPFAAQLRSEMIERDGKAFHRVEGYASVFDTPYPMWDEFGPYDEVVVSGAADLTLSGKPHVVFLANHGGLAMASTKNGTLELSTDRTGLKDVAYLNPGRTDVSDLVQAIADETIEEQSFAFFITDGVWTQDFTQFRIMAFDIDRGDVSAVNYGANPHTSIAARQREIFAELRRMGPAQARAAAQLLNGVETAPVDPDTIGELVRAEVAARMDKPTSMGTSLVHRWATLMGDDS